MTKEDTGKRWRCSICGYVAAGSEPPDKCPVCGASRDKFEPVQGESDLESGADSPGSGPTEEEGPLLDEYLAEWSRAEYETEEKFTTIQKLAETGKSEISPMGTRRPFPGLEAILFRGYNVPASL